MAVLTRYWESAAFSNRSMSKFDDIVARTEATLTSRQSRPADYLSENQALLSLADEMADRPENVLRRLCDLVIEVCGAESAGVSMIEGESATGDFYWPAISGAWSPYMGGGMPRDASPCGVVIARDAPLMFHDVVAQFPAAAQAQPPIAEILLAPFHRDGQPVGTVWAIAHDPAKKFDLEDRRMLLSLARFAGAAYQTTRSDKAARSAEARVQLANRELGHRIKNILAMVQAISAQTFRHSAGQEQVSAFTKRIHALADAQDLLIQTANDAASIGDIVPAVLRSISVSAQVRSDGPEVTLGPRAALALALSLHELGTNATKYGALSRDSGEVQVSWDIDPADNIIIDWRETGGPPVIEPSRKGFGTKLISMGLLGDGGVDLDFAQMGLKARFTAPLERARLE